MTAIESFSGTHPFKSSCLEEALRDDYGDDADLYVDDLLIFIDDGICPRCGENPLYPPDVSREIWYPAGSRVTACRCIPVCSNCGGDEGWVGSVPPMYWPVDGVNERRKMIDALPVVTGTIELSPDGKLTLLTEDGVGDVKLREHPGGWAEFGHDDDKGGL